MGRGRLSKKTKISLHKGEILMNDPHKFGTEFGSDHALEQSTPMEPELWQRITDLFDEAMTRGPKERKRNYALN